MKVINYTQSHEQSRVSIYFSCTVTEFKILVIPNVLAHEKLYENGFPKKYDGHKLYAKSSFVRFFVHCLENSKY
ncbi:hypothetical protein GW17_00055067 [Ensete ventricosum]|nr:hypothetical protein GW17_00055067 [Ensete ventricosum]